MTKYDTGVACPHCKTVNIVAEPNFVATVSENQMPMGPASRDYHKIQLTFYCPTCQTVFRYPPGKPEVASEILQKIQDQQELDNWF